MPHLLRGCLTILTSSCSGHVPLWSCPDSAWFIVAFLPAITLPCWLVGFSVCQIPAKTCSLQSPYAHPNLQAPPSPIPPAPMQVLGGSSERWTLESRVTGWWHHVRSSPKLCMAEAMEMLSLKGPGGSAWKQKGCMYLRGRECKSKKSWARSLELEKNKNKKIRWGDCCL